MLVSTETLAAHLSDSRWILFDCRHDLADPGKGERLYRESHLPGAHFASVDRDLSGAKTGQNGRHPLPTPEAFAAFLARHGVSDDSVVVAYDDSGGLFAARFWWMARWVGVSQVNLLDGGWPKWKGEGRRTEAVLPPASVGSWRVRPGSPASVWTTVQVQAHLQDPAVTLIDARAADRYRGENETIDPVAGHIPGAINRFYKANLQADGTFRPSGDLRREFTALLGARRPEDVVHSCGSGITACANQFAMEWAGLPGSKVYAGSWSEWIADPTRPVAKGPQP